jgi:hypothetical protein
MVMYGFILTNDFTKICCLYCLGFDQEIKISSQASSVSQPFSGRLSHCTRAKATWGAEIPKCQLGMG